MPQLDKEKNIVLAIQALRNDPKLRIYPTAKKYKVPPSTLYDRYHGKPFRGDLISNSRKLSDPEEQIIIEYIIDLDSRGFPPRLRSVEEMANRLLAHRDTSPVSKRWACNFIKRQPDLKKHFDHSHVRHKAKSSDPAPIRDWFRLVENTIEKYGIELVDIYNFDGTGFMMGMIASRMVITGAEGRRKAKSIQLESREWITVIQAINAEGCAIPPFIVVASQDHIANWHQESSLPEDWAIVTTHNGWADNDTSLAWLKHFNQHTTGRSTGRYRLLIIDGYDSHHSVEFEKYCEDNNIITLCMPPNSSRLLQPLDIGCFEPLKQAYSQEIEELTESCNVSTAKFFQAFYAAHQATMTRSNIKNGFRGAGLVPLDPASVISKLHVRLRTTTPVRDEESLASPWVPRTPKTVLEAVAQSEYLKRQIEKHRGSPPPSILGALESLAKGTRAIMQKVTSLQSEVQGLQQSTAILRKQRGAKRAGLRSADKIASGQAKDGTSQEDVYTQVRSELSRSGSPGSAAAARERRCGRCGKSGHNSRTCQIIAGRSGEGNSN
ncbi:hypothetical protein HOO65_050478 [Ceratocystis lukuohia]|uniref:Transposase n=1 Tax=Ceratocystis lukuohia TaxID=2019550 RepID=A0ABR4MGK6_9PEZI